MKRTVKYGMRALVATRQFENVQFECAEEIELEPGENETEIRAKMIARIKRQIEGDVQELKQRLKRRE